MVSVVELRQYTLLPDQRDVLIDLFDREFVESQEAHGMRVYGQFRDADDPNRFVWIRGFADMEQRREALTAFYSGPVWKANSAAANATMVDVDNVLLLRPIGAGFDVPDPDRRPPVGAPEPATVIVAVVARPGDVVPTGGDEVGRFETEHAENTFPALPVRAGEQVEVSFRRFADVNAGTRFSAGLGDMEHRVLMPTGRSQLR